MFIYGLIVGAMLGGNNHSRGGGWHGIEHATRQWQHEFKRDWDNATLEQSNK